MSCSSVATTLNDILVHKANGIATAKQWDTKSFQFGYIQWS